MPEEKKPTTKAEKLAKALEEIMELPAEERDGTEIYFQGVRAGLALARAERRMSA